MKTPALLVASALAALLVALPAAADQALASARACLACHRVDKKVIGPAFRDVAKKYAGTPGAAAMLETRILKGSSGVWGPIAMPGSAQVSAAEAKKLAAWVMSLK